VTRSHLLRVLASLSGEFDIPDYGLDLDTVRLDRAANVDLDRDGFREHHGGDQARPDDWGAPLDESSSSQSPTCRRCSTISTTERGLDCGPLAVLLRP